MPRLLVTFHEQGSYGHGTAVRDGLAHVATRVPRNPVGELENYVVTTIDSLRATRLACGTLTKEPAGLAVLPR